MARLTFPGRSARRYGLFELLGMVKDGNNRIRKHIPKAYLPKSDKAPKIKKDGVLQAVKDNEVVLAGTFQKSLKEYLKAFKKGKLNTKVVDNLLSALDELEEKKPDKDIELTIPASQLTELIFNIFTYTESLAKANDYNVQVAKPKSGTKGNIVSLKSYLEIQKEIMHWEH